MAGTRSSGEIDELREVVVAVGDGAKGRSD